MEIVEKQWDNYHQWEATVKAQVFTAIPEALLIEVQKLKTAEVWDAICIKHTRERHLLLRSIYADRCMNRSAMMNHRSKHTSRAYSA